MLSMANNDFVGGIVAGTISMCIMQIMGMPFGSFNWWLMYFCLVGAIFYIKILIEEFFLGKI